MRKFSLYLIAVVVFCASCQFKLDSAEDDRHDNAVTIERFDRLQSRYLTTGDYAALQQMSTQYPTETRTLIEDILQLGEVSDPHINSQFLSFYQDTTLQVILNEVQIQYADLSDVSQAMEGAFQRLLRNVPDLSIPRIYTQVGALNQSVVISDSTIGISLDKYLGADFEPYTRFYDEQERATMTRANIVPDCILFYLLSRYPLKDFETRTQAERDEHMGKVMWATNQILGKAHFNTPFVKKAANYAHAHPHENIPQLLKSN